MNITGRSAVLTVLIALSASVASAAVSVEERVKRYATAVPLLADAIVAKNAASWLTCAGLYSLLEIKNDGSVICHRRDTATVMFTKDVYEGEQFSFLSVNGDNLILYRPAIGDAKSVAELRDNGAIMNMWIVTAASQAFERARLQRERAAIERLRQAQDNKPLID